MRGLGKAAVTSGGGGQGPDPAGSPSEGQRDVTPLGRSGRVPGVLGPQHLSAQASVRSTVTEPICRDQGAGSCDPDASLVFTSRCAFLEAPGCCSPCLSFSLCTTWRTRPPSPRPGAAEKTQDRRPRSHPAIQPRPLFRLAAHGALPAPLYHTQRCRPLSPCTPLGTRLPSPHIRVSARHPVG